jgi:hypothetical protein
LARLSQHRSHETFGLAPSRVDDKPDFGVGQRVANSRGREYVYVQAGGEIAAGALVSFTCSDRTSAHGIALGLTGEDDRLIGAAQEMPTQPIVAGRYFWARVSGMIEGLDAREEQP